MPPERLAAPVFALLGPKTFLRNDALDPRAAKPMTTMAPPPPPGSTPEPLREIKRQSRGAFGQARRESRERYHGRATS